ncbi:MAG TPA: hypothetical protein V6D31_11395 [Candidatus Sericytochromatia bacterium]
MSPTVFAAGAVVARAERAIAKVAFSIDGIAKQISQQIDFPILLPSEDVLDRNKFLVGSGNVLYATVPSISQNGKYEIAFNNQPGNLGNAAFRFYILETALGI